ncbi:hypothetical protein WAI453_008724 [Rhynchosporium graminicola]
MALGGCICYSSYDILNAVLRASTEHYLPGFPYEGLVIGYLGIILFPIPNPNLEDAEEEEDFQPAARPSNTSGLKSIFSHVARNQVKKVLCTYRYMWGTASSESVSRG